MDQTGPSPKAHDSIIATNSLEPNAQRYGIPPFFASGLIAKLSYETIVDDISIMISLFIELDQHINFCTVILCE